MLAHKHLRQARPAQHVVSLLVSISYVKYVRACFVDTYTVVQMQGLEYIACTLPSSVHLYIRLDCVVQATVGFVVYECLAFSCVAHPVILGPQLIDHKLNNTIMRTTANVVSHMDIEQGKRPIGLGMVGKPTLVGVGVDLTLDRRSLRRLSHFFSFFLFPVFYQRFCICQPP